MQMTFFFYLRHFEIMWNGVKIKEKQEKPEEIILIYRRSCSFYGKWKKNGFSVKAVLKALNLFWNL